MPTPTPQNLILEQIKNSARDKEALEKLRKLFPDEVAQLEAARPVNKYLADLVTKDPKMMKLKADVKTVSEVNDPVLILGETGTGKELIARALNSDREPFIAINCAGIPENLVESELFGHKKGAFTGAVNEKVGLLQVAYGGSVFLDEIGDLPLNAQAKLLRAIQENKIRMVGDENAKEIDIKCRFICATHKDLEAMVNEEKFRDDLYYRISTFTFKTIPLRYRTQDILPIVKRIVTLDKDISNYDIEDFEEFCEPIIRNKDRLKGNVRQLQQIVRVFHVLGKNIMED